MIYLSAAVYSLFGANIAHAILNWKEDAVIFRRSAHGHAPKPISKKYARWGRLLRVFILGLWFTCEVCYAFYDKVVKCRWGIVQSMQEKLDDFDKDPCYVKGNTENQNPCWWCYTETCYSSHLYGFLAGTIIL